MAGQFPEEFISDLRNRADIVTVINEHIPLKKQGRNYIGLCPFHAEKTPSFVVSPEKQIYHCFGCGKGGNVFSFIMDKNTLTFPETIEYLAQKVGLALPEINTSPERKKEDLARKKYYRINELTAEYYRRILFEPAGKEALHYLLTRGLKPEAIEKFILGYAPQGWDSLILYLRKHGFDIADMLKAGVVVKTQKENTIDRFRKRIIFPINDEFGRTIGFGGRVLDDSLPKYLNSPDTPLFSKGKHLYGLHVTKGSIREKDHVIIMEGYMDVITSWQHGIDNVAGTLGTALTPEQVRLIMKYTYHAHICFDADTAGEKAALRGLDILRKQGCDVSVITIPGSKDPDEFIRKEGAKNFAAVLKNAQSLFEYKLGRRMKNKDMHSVPERIKIVQNMIPDILDTKSPIARQANIQLLAEKLIFPESAIHAEIKKTIQNQGKETAPKQVSPPNVLSAIDRAQRIILRMASESPESFAEIERMGGSDLCKDASVRGVYGLIARIISAGDMVEADKLISLLDDPEEQELVAEIFMDEELPEEKARIYQDCLLLLRNEWIHRRIELNSTKMSEFENKGEATKAMELMVEIQELVKEKKNLSLILKKGGE